MLNIVQYPAKILRFRSKKIKDFSSEKLKSFIPQFKETMIKKDGIGLAANQVGEDFRLLAVNFDGQAKIFINPFIYYKSFNKAVEEEGCLSFPGIFGKVKRPEKIKLFYRDEDGVLRHISAKGLLARVLQHEIDHINGILFIDKIKEYTYGADKINKLREQADLTEI